MEYKEFTPEFYSTYQLLNINIAEKDDVIAMKDAEIARLKALLENK